MINKDQTKIITCIFTLTKGIDEDTEEIDVPIDLTSSKSEDDQINEEYDVWVSDLIEKSWVRKLDLKK